MDEPNVAAVVAAYEEQINDYERHVVELEDRVNNLAADLLEARAQRHELAKRCEAQEVALAELAVVRDAQFKALLDLNEECKTLSAKLRDADAARDNAVERLNLAMSALVGTGYFTAYQVSGDVAPRIVEMHSALARQLEEARAEAQIDRVSREAAELDRDEAVHGREVAWAEVERLRKELAEMGAKP